MTKPLAHSPNTRNQPHYLSSHLTAVAALARQHCPWFPELAYYAGLWHDLGKYKACWQDRLSTISQGERLGISHCYEGAVFAAQFSPEIALCIRGHHAGIPDLNNLSGEIRNAQSLSNCHLDNAIAAATNDGFTLPPDKPLPSPGKQSTLTRAALDLAIRMVFSALVDADYSDTTQHFQPHQSPPEYKSLQTLWHRFHHERAKKLADADPNTPINQTRQNIYDRCLYVSDKPRGWFKLCAPTGGGKTFALMGFALRHAIANDLQRIIYVAPLTTILEQTATIYRDLMGNDSILEHHSAIQGSEKHNDDTSNLRFAAQNWTQPIIITTTVQLLESLFSNRPVQCRKLHNIANAVIIFDEIQTLPLSLLKPILDRLQALVRDYNCSIIACTATQPAYQYIAKKYDPIDIIPPAITAKHFKQFKRVDYINHAAQKMSWTDVIEEIQQRRLKQCLIVCNTVKDAQAGFATLTKTFPGNECFHLSSLMCGAHRQDVLARIEQRLGDNKPTFLISTQLIEAGIDISFEHGYRVLGPLDSIVQTAGRINRHGNKQQATLTIFSLQAGTYPPGDYKNNAAIAQELLEDGADLNKPEVFEQYFAKRFAFKHKKDTDTKDISAKINQLKFETISQDFKLIEADSFTVFIPYGQSGLEILAEISQKDTIDATDHRKMQPYYVSIKQNYLKKLQPYWEEVSQGFLILGGEIYKTTIGIDLAYLGEGKD